MAFLETGTFCTAAEYTGGLPRRVKESQLRKGDLYTLVMRLDGEKREAAKMATRPLEIANEVGFAVIHFTFLDPDLNPTHQVRGVAVDGLFNQLKDAKVIDTASQDRFNIRQAYFKDYFEDQFGGMLAQNSELSLAS